MATFKFKVNTEQTLWVTVEAESAGQALKKMADDPHIWSEILHSEIDAITNVKFIGESGQLEDEE